MDLMYDIYKTTFFYRYFNDFFSLGIVWVIVVIGYNYVIIRDILTKDNPLYLVIFWISFSISMVFPNLYLELLIIIRDYINSNLFQELKAIKIVMMGYYIILTPIIFIFLYFLYFILYIFRSRFFTKDDFFRIRGSKKHWDVSIPNTILHIVAAILVFGTLARYIFITQYVMYGEEGTKIPTTDIILGAENILNPRSAGSNTGVYTVPTNLDTAKNSHKYLIKVKGSVTF